MNKIQTRIVDLLKEKKEDITINQIAAELGIDRHTAGKHLEILEGMGICQFRSVGKSKMWKLTASPLLSFVSENSPLRTELEEVLGVIGDNIHIRTKNYNILWSNRTGEAGKNCADINGDETTDCENCALEKALESGNPEEEICSSCHIYTKPIKDKLGNTIAVIGVRKDKKK